MTEKKRLIIIDANSIIHRAFHALPPLTTKKGELVNAIYGFLLVFLKAVKELQPDFVIACFDVPGPTLRHRQFKEYKAKRPPAPENLYSQIPKVKSALEVFAVPVFEKEGFEADDLIGTIAKEAARKQVLPPMETIILSGDADILQLVDSRTEAFNLKKGVKDIVLYDEEKVKERFGGLNPEQLIDFKALRGDPSDNIPGVTGIGEKTAVKLIKEFQTLENLYQNLDKVPAKTKELLSSYKDQAFLSRELSRIRKDAPVDLNLPSARWPQYNKSKVVELFRQWEFNSLIDRLPRF